MKKGKTENPNVLQVKSTEAKQKENEKTLKKELKKDARKLSIEEKLALKVQAKQLKNEQKTINKTQKQELKTQKKFQKQAKKEQKKLEKQKIVLDKEKEFGKRLIDKNSIANWFKIDNAGNIYPSIKEENWSFVFRVSAVLKDKVNPDIMQRAIEDIAPRFPTFFVSVKNGFFWNYFEALGYTPKLKLEHKFPCSSFYHTNTKKHSIRFVYYNNRISFECFHALCDGRSALKLFNSLLHRYFLLQGKKIESFEGCLNALDRPKPEETDDAFFIHSDNGKKQKHKEEKALKIKGVEEEYGVINTTLGIMSVSELKAKAKEYNTSMFIYLLAVLGYTIYKRNKNSKKPVRLSVPIDLRQFFETETLRNFSAYINVTIDTKKEQTIQSVIAVVEEEFKKINKEYLKSFINSNTAIQKNKFIRILPLFIKKIFIRLFFNLWGENYQTLAVSNLGLAKVPNEFLDYVDRYEVNLGAPKYNSKSVGVVSLGDKLVWTFSSKIKENRTEKDFFNYLANDGVKIKLESNRRDIYA